MVVADLLESVLEHIHELERLLLGRSPLLSDLLEDGGEVGEIVDQAESADRGVDDTRRGEVERAGGRGDGSADRRLVQHELVSVVRHHDDTPAECGEQLEALEVEAEVAAERRLGFGQAYGIEQIGADQSGEEARFQKRPWLGEVDIDARGCARSSPSSDRRAMRRLSRLNGTREGCIQGGEVKSEAGFQIAVQRGHVDGRLGLGQQAADRNR